MTNFVELAQNKQAADFKTLMEAVMAEKVAHALEERKVVIASSLFEDSEEGSEESSNGRDVKNQEPCHEGPNSGLGVQAKKVNGYGVEEGSVSEAVVAESGKKWLQHAVHPSRAGMFKGRSKESLETQEHKLVKSGPHKKGSRANTKEHQLQFAIRAKSGGFSKK